MFIVAIAFFAFYVVYYLPSLLGIQLWAAFIRYMNTLCYQHPKLVTKSTLSAIIGILTAYYFHTDITLAVKYAGYGVLTGGILHLLSLIFKA